MSSVIEMQNRAELDRMFRDMGIDLMGNMRIQLYDQDKNFTGKLSKSIHLSKDGETWLVVVDSPYGIPVEYGLPPGTYVNFDALLAWVQGKLGITDYEEARQVTYKIRSKILGKGIRPSRFTKKAIKALIFGKSLKRARMPRRKRGRFEKFLNKASKLTKKAQKTSKRIAKNLSTISRITGVGKI